jgi:hypothetical protein
MRNRCDLRCIARWNVGLLMVNDREEEWVARERVYNYIGVVGRE